MTRKRSRSGRSPANLPQRPETWLFAARQLRIWITPENEDPWRPFTAVVFNLDRGLVQGMDIQLEYPSPEATLALIIEAMQQTPAGARLKPHRPTRLLFEDPDMPTALKAELAALGVESRFESQLPEIGELFADFEENMRGGPELPGLLAGAGVTPELVAGLFSAAASFYRAEPWIDLVNEHTFAVQTPSEAEPRFVQVMGNAGMEYGLATYRRWADVERMFQASDHPLELIPEDGANSFFFGPVNRLPFDDFEAMQTYDWEVAGQDAFPVPIRFLRDEDPQRPGRADIEWYQATLLALPVFIEQHLEPAGAEKFHPAEADVSVISHSGEQLKVHIKYPGGALPGQASRPVNRTDWVDLEADEEETELPTFDRRVVEGALAHLTAGPGGAQGDEAQAIMYRAWEEKNPARRIILANEALSISPDCADAYVLLAEEAADTRARALEYWEKGVAAGERALGAETFAENAGHFWGLLETRPYMRARQGLANLLWDMGRLDEASAHYRDLLRLNPRDNQGVRYSLLNLLVGQQRDAEAKALLAEYEGDGMAEWLYTRALLLFREAGKTPASRQALRQALKQNLHVPKYLTGRKRIPNRRPPYMGWGDENEAIHYAASHLAHWRRTPGALAWLKSQLKPKGARPRKKTKKKKKRGRGSGKN